MIQHQSDFNKTKSCNKIKNEKGYNNQFLCNAEKWPNILKKSSTPKKLSIRIASF